METYKIKVLLTIRASNREGAKRLADNLLSTLVRRDADGYFVRGQVDERREGFAAWLRRRFAKDKFRGRSLIMVSALALLLPACYGPVCGGRWMRGYPTEGSYARVAESHATTDGTRELWWLEAEEIAPPYVRYRLTVDAPVRKGERVLVLCTGKDKWRVERLDYRKN